MSSTFDLVALARRYYRPHGLAFGIFSVPALVLMLIFAQWWLFWPLMVWALVFLVHVLVIKSVTVSSDWIAERTTRAADKAYDIAIIEQLHERYNPPAPKPGQARPARVAEDEGGAAAQKDPSGRQP